MAAKTTTLTLRCSECGAMTHWIISTDDLTTVECGECGEKIDPVDAAAELADQAERWTRFGAWLAGAASV